MHILYLYFDNFSIHANYRQDEKRCVICTLPWYVCPTLNVSWCTLDVHQGDVQESLAK
jgi:hypothetical protein